MNNQKNTAPRRYFVDAQGRRVLIGLSLEETTEFEMLDGSPAIGEDGWKAVPVPARECRWLELYAKHDEAWKAWIAQSRAEHAANSAFVNHS